MIKTFLLLAISALSFYQCTHAQKESKGNAAPGTTKIAYGNEIPVYFAIHNEHKNSDSLRLELIDNTGKSTTVHKGKFEGWGMRYSGVKVKTGEYQLVLHWQEESGMKSTIKRIVVKSEAEWFSINVELANDSLSDREYNAIYVDQYVKPLANVTFKRNWDPQKQFSKDSLLLPDYTITNKNDSIVYGAYLRFSSRLSINWVQPHYIGFMQFEEKTDSEWQNMRCSAPRIDMEVHKGKTAETLKDMVLGCSVKNFIPGKTYRVVIPYMLNERIFEKNPAIDGFEDNVYVEQTIYNYADEFKINK